MNESIPPRHSSPSIAPPLRASLTSVNHSLEYRVVETNAHIKHAYCMVMDYTFNQRTASHRHPTCHFL